jgi:hypothetical protein
VVPKTTEAQALGGSPVPGTGKSLPLRCNFRLLKAYSVTVRGRLMVRWLTLDQLMWVQLLPPQSCYRCGGTWYTRRLKEAVSPEMWIRLPPSALFCRHRLAVQDIAPQGEYVSSSLAGGTFLLSRTAESRPRGFLAVTKPPTSRYQTWPNGRQNILMPGDARPVERQREWRLIESSTTRRDKPMGDGSGLENRRGASPWGFETLSLRSYSNRRS